jgi:3-oxoadipate enol-lactonase
MMKKMKVGQNEIAYKVIGEGETIVLLHGFCGSSSYWDKIIPELSNEFRLLLVDLRGHGQSSTESSPFTIDDLAKDVKEILDSLKLGQVFMFGHSLGGYVTLSVVEHFPEKIKGYGLIHSTAYPDSEEAKIGRTNSANLIEQNGILPFIDGLVAKLFSDENLEVLKEVVQDVKEIGYSTNPNAAMDTLKAMRGRPDRNEVLKKDIPTLLIAGEDDKIIAPTKTFSVEGKHISTKIIANSGHMSMYENPKELIYTIREFMDFAKSC